MKIRILQHLTCQSFAFTESSSSRMFSIATPLPPPRRNLEDDDEDLLEGLGAENLLEAKDSIEPPVLRWKESFHQEMMMQNQGQCHGRMHLCL